MWNTDLCAGMRMQMRLVCGSSERMAQLIAAGSLQAGDEAGR